MPALAKRERCSSVPVTVVLSVTAQGTMGGRFVVGPRRICRQRGVFGPIC